MSSIDQRVVEMRFDNQQFESGIKTSLSSLDKLKSGLNFDKATSALDDLSKAGSRVDFGGIASGIETMVSKFNIFEGTIQRVKDHLMDMFSSIPIKITDMVTSMSSLEQASAGFSKYSEKTQAVQTIMAATAKDFTDTGEQMEYVSAQLEKLNWFTDETSYAFLDMVNNIGKFTNNGIKLDSAVTSMEGISTWAALAGANTEEAGRAMYNLSQAMSVGAVKLQDWKSIENANMATAEFKETAMQTAVEMGILSDQFEILEPAAKYAGDAIVDVANFSQTLSSGWFSADVLSATLAKYGDFTDQLYVAADAFGEQYDTVSELLTALDEYQEGTLDLQPIMESTGMTAEEVTSIFDELAKSEFDLGKKGFKAAQEAKTFEEAIAATKDAVSTGWMTTWEMIFGDYQEAKVLWTDLANELWNVFAASGEVRNEMLKGWKELGGRDELIQSFWNIWNAVADVVSNVKEAFREIFPRTTSEQLYNMTHALKEFTERLKMSDETSAKLNTTFRGLFAAIDIVWQIVKALGGGIVELIKHFSSLGGGILGITSNIGGYLVNLDESIKQTDFFGEIVSKVTGFIITVGDKIRELTGKVSEFFKKLKSANSDGEFKKASEGALPILQRILDRLNQIGEAAGTMRQKVVDAFKNIAASLSKIKIVDTIQNVWNTIKTFIGNIAKALSDLIGNVLGKIGNADFNGLIDLINSLSIGGIALAIKNFSSAITSPLEALGNFSETISGIMGKLGDVLEAYQTKLKGEALKEIAIAIAILAASLVALSLIDSDKLMKAVAAITTLFADLMGTFGFMSNLSGGTTAVESFVQSKAWKNIATTMIELSVAVLILSGALKNLSDLDWDQIAKGLVGIAGLAAIVSAMAFAMSKMQGKMAGGAVSIVILAYAIKILADAMKTFVWMDWEQIAKGLVAVGGLMAEVALYSRFAKSNILASTGIVILAAALRILMKSFVELMDLEWEQIGKGLAAIGGLLTELALFSRFSKGDIFSATGVVVLAAGFEIFVDVMKKIIELNPDEIKTALITIGVALAEFSIALNVMKGTLSGAASMVVLTAALAAFVPILKALGGLAWGDILKGLATLAGLFTILGIAGAALKPVVGTILKLSAAIAILGAGLALVGAGIFLAGVGLDSLSVGIIALSASMATAATAIVGTLKIIIGGIIGLIPTIATGVKRAILSICQIVIECAPALSEAFTQIVLSGLDALIGTVPEMVEKALVIVEEVLDSLLNHAPEITDKLFSILIEVLNVLADRIPELVVAAVNVLKGFVQGLRESLDGISVAQIAGFFAAITVLALIFKLLANSVTDALKATVTIALLLVLIAGITAAFIAMEDLDGLNTLAIATALSEVMLAMAGAIAILQGIPIQGALKAIADMDLMVANLALVLTALGALYQIPGLDTLINDGARFLEDIGSAIGGFVGGIVGGFAKGVSDSFPAIGTNLSLFAENVKPFLDTMGKVDSSTLDSVGAVANAILKLTAAELLDGISKWLGLGDNSLVSFGKELAEFAPYLKSYADDITGINADAITLSMKVAEMIADFANHVPKTGGWLQKITGENSIAAFGEELAAFGPNLAKFCESVTGVYVDDVGKAIAAAQIVSEFAQGVPKTGGWLQKITGENSIAVFGEELASFGPNLAKFCESVTGVYVDDVGKAIAAAQIVSEFAQGVPKTGGWLQKLTGENSIAAFGEEAAAFGPNLALFAESIHGINVDDVAAATAAGEMLSGLASTLPETGGLAQWFMGEQDMSAFGESLVDFGEGLSSYSNSVSGIDIDQVKGATAAAQGLVDLANYTDDWSDISANFSTFGGRIASFGENLATYWGWIQDIKTSTMAGVTKEFKDLVAAVNTIDAAAAELLIDFGAALKDLSGVSDLSAFGDEISELGDKLQDYNEKIADLNTLKIRSSITAVQDLAEMSTTIDWNSNTNFEDFGNGIKTLGSNLNEYWNSIQSVTPSTLEAITKEIRSLVNVAKSLTSGAGSALETFGSGLKSIGEAGLDNFVSAVQNGGSKISAAATSMMTQYINAVDSKSALLKAAFTAVIREIIDDLNTKAALFTTTGMKQMDGLISGIKLKENSFKTAFTNSVQTAINALKDKTATFSEIGESYISKLTDAMKQKSQLSTSTVNSVVNAITDKFREKYTIFNAIGSTFADKMISGLGAKASDASSKAMYVASNAASNARTKYWDFYSAGEYMVTGFCNGIQANNYRAAAKARAMAQSAVTAAQNQLRIQSPSKVFYQIGDYAGQGFVNGLDDSRSSAYDASSSMADFAINGIKSAVDRINEMVNDSIDTNPVIRPTIDLTDVRTGSSALASILNDPSLMGLDGSSALAGRVGSQIDRYMSAQATDPTLTALADLKTSIDTIGAGGQTVNNTFYITGDDPQEIANEVSRILQQQVERRDAQWA